MWISLACKYSSQSLSFSLLWLLHEEITDGVIAGELDLHLSPALHHLLASSQGGGTLLRTGTQEVHTAFYPAPPPDSPHQNKSIGSFMASTTDSVHSPGRSLPLLSTLSPSL